MKTKLLRIVRKRANFCAHITGITTTTTAFIEVVSGITIGYGTADNYDDYKDIWEFGMDEETYNRKVCQKYWMLNKDKYINKYRKRQLENYD